MRREWSVAGLAAAVALLTSSVLAQTATTPDLCAEAVNPNPLTPGEVAQATREVLNPQWLTVPSGASIALLYPPRAVRDHVSGTAVVECRIELDHTLADCRILEERPAHYGFGEATIKFLRKARMRPRMVDGAPCTNSVIRYPMEWRLG